jgi:hypothetical protein
MKPIKAWARAYDEPGSIPISWDGRLAVYKTKREAKELGMYDQHIVRVEIRELPSKRKPRAPRGTR